MATFFELRITLHGVIIPVGAAENDPLTARFSEHEAAGIIALAARGAPAGFAPSLAFWQDIAGELLRELCHVPEGAAPDESTVEPPGPARLAEWVLNALPMPGAEYLSPQILRAVENQATDRAFRIGQCRYVLVQKSSPAAPLRKKSTPSSARNNRWPTRFSTPTPPPPSPTTKS